MMKKQATSSQPTFSQPTSSQPTLPSENSYGNVVIHTIPYGGKKGQQQLTCTCPVDTSLTLIQSVLTHKNIYEKAITFAEADPNSQTCRLLQVFDLMKQKRWVEAKFLWIENLSSYIKSEKKKVNLFGSLSECFFEQFFHDSLDQNLIVVKSTVTTVCDSSYCSKKILSLANSFDIILT